MKTEPHNTETVENANTECSHKLTEMSQEQFNEMLVAALNTPDIRDRFVKFITTVATQGNEDIERSINNAMAMGLGR